MITQLKTLIVLVVTLSLSACATSDVHKSASSKEKGINYEIQLVGGPTTILEYAGVTIVTDPTFDAAGGKYDIKFAVLEKTKGPAVASNLLPKIDLALLSHDQHADNFDTEGRELVSSGLLTLTTEAGKERLGGNSVGLEWWESHTIGDVEITAVPAQHGPAAAVSKLGTVNGFIVSSSSGPTVYISGDTVPFEGTDEIVKRYKGKIDYAILHTGAVARGDTYFTMNASEAVALAAKLDAKSFSIIHADSWSHFTEKLPAATDTAKASKISGRFLDLSDNRAKKF